MIGDVDKLNKIRLEDLKANRTKLQDFHDSFKGFKLISRLEKNPDTMSAAISKLASHVIGETKVEMKNISKARYSYLSTKIAKQRATSTKSKKLYEAAELKRQNLRKRQQQFQTELTKARLVARRYYPDCKIHPRRTLSNTEHALGAPQFRQNMIKMGYLPKEIRARPKSASSRAMRIPTTVNIAKESLKNVSQMNFSKGPRIRHIPEPIAAAKI